jgi:hypothetical protein
MRNKFTFKKKYKTKKFKFEKTNFNMSSKLAVLASLFVCVCACLALEQPSYQVVKKLSDNVEIRKYAPSKWVSASAISTCETIRGQNSALFQRLFGYISGQNNQNSKIEMTSPVLTQVKSIGDSKNCQMTMSFYIPKVNQANTPVPTGNALLQQFDEVTVAAIRFGGMATISDYEYQRNLLTQSLGSDLNTFDNVNMITAGYNAPYQLVGRTNEVWFEKL